MSIYIYSQLLRKKFDGVSKYHLPDESCNSIVANGIGGKKPHIMRLDDYSEDKLTKLVLDKPFKEIYVDYRFWNYRYCSPQNLKIENLKCIRKVENDPYIVPSLYYVGMVVVMIMYYQIFYYTFTIKNDDVFKTYLREINIDRDDFSDFMISNNIVLPLTMKYIMLLVRIFSDDNIGEYLFATAGEWKYNIEDTSKILSFFTVVDIRNYAKLIFESDENVENKLKYFNIVLELYDGSIDYHEKVFSLPYPQKGKELQPVGYYLFPLGDKISDDLFNLYTYTLEKYMLLDGAETVEMI